MIGLTVDFDAILAVVPGDAANLYWNVDASGIASGDVNTATAINDAPVPLFPGQKEITWGAGGWGEDTWGGSLGDPALSIELPAVCFGNVKIQGQSVDKYGNAQSGYGTVGELFVDSTPQSPANFTRGAWSAITGKQTFTFTASPQVG